MLRDKEYPMFQASVYDSFLLQWRNQIWQSLPRGRCRKARRMEESGLTVEKRVSELSETEWAA